MKTTHKLRAKAALGIILALTIISAIWVGVFEETKGQKSGSTIIPYDVRIVTHLNDLIPPSTITSMLDELKVVKGVQIQVWVGDNTTSGIWDALIRLSKYLDVLSNYSIVIQCDYAFVEKYGYYENPFWKWNNTSTMSQTWYNNWYGNLSFVVNQHPNVKLMVGYNEAYNHFQNKEDAQSVMKMEYITWKRLSNISFSTEFLMPYTFWADYWNFPKNASIEQDCVPFWANYSDYVGVNIWTDNAPPEYGFGQGGFDREKQVVAMLENYSQQLQKPIHVNEFPAWKVEDFKYICDNLMKSPNISQVYQLWYWGGQEDTHIDSTSYGLYAIDPATLNVTKTPAWYIFESVLNPPG